MPVAALASDAPLSNLDEDLSNQIIDISSPRTPSAFTPKFVGNAYQYDSIIKARDYLLSQGITEIGNDQFKQLEGEKEEEYLFRLFTAFNRILKMRFFANLGLDDVSEFSDDSDYVEFIEQAEQTARKVEQAKDKIHGIFRRALFFYGNCYKYAILDWGNRPENPGFSKKRALLQFNKPEKSPFTKLEYFAEESTIAAVADAAIKDGLQRAELDARGYPIPKNGETVEDSFYLVALYVKDYDGKRDFHWVMENREGWSSQIGKRNFLLRHKEVEWPHLELGFNNYQFAGYFYVPSTGLKVGKQVNKDFAWQLAVYKTAPEGYWEKHGIKNVYDPRAFKFIPADHTP